MKKETVEIVRCKDCVWWDITWKSRNNYDQVIYHYCPVADRETSGNFYCADGEAINDDEE